MLFSLLCKKDLDDVPPQVVSMLFTKPKGSGGCVKPEDDDYGMTKVSFHVVCRGVRTCVGCTTFDSLSRNS